MLAGFVVNDESEYNYMHIVSKMDKKLREPYFFLKANDTLFKPEIQIEGKNLDVDLHDLEGNITKFTSVKPGEKGYFIIAVPST